MRDLVLDNKDSLCNRGFTRTQLSFCGASVDDRNMTETGECGGFSVSDSNPFRPQWLGSDIMHLGIPK